MAGTYKQNNTANISIRTYLYEKEHRDFAGIICIEDFNTNYPNPHKYYARTHTEQEVLKKQNQNGGINNEGKNQ